MINRTNTSLYTVRQLAHKVPHLSLPPYQRPFVWTEDDILALIDSVSRGLPIGQILIWDTRLNGAEHAYVIDGQHRLAALSGRVPGSPVENFTVCYDVDEVRFVLGPEIRGRRFRCYDEPGESWLAGIMDRHLPKGERELFERFQPALNEVDRLRSAEVVIHTLGAEFGPEDVAEAFLRLNTRGHARDAQETADAIAAWRER